MYKFVDTISYSDEVFAPSDNLKVNGRYLNNLINGYRQLYVSGRSLISQDVEHEKIPGKAGAHVKSVHINPREIEVFYMLEARNSVELREQFAMLNQVLRGELSLVFDDEPEFTYTGYLSGTDEIAEQTLTIKSSFKLFVPNPYKQRVKQSSNGAIDLKSAREVLPLKLIVTTTKTTDNVEIINGAKRMKLVGNYNANTTITFEWTDSEVKITYLNRSILRDLYHLSVPEEFVLRNKDVVRATNATVTLIEWRDEQL